LIHGPSLQLLKLSKSAPLALTGCETGEFLIAALIALAVAGHPMARKIQLIIEDNELDPT
jgi:hypothetical protein